MRILTSFIGFVLAICVTILIFAPERLPVGYGFEPVPVELTVENSLAGQLVESLIGQSGKNLVITNTHTRPIYNLTVTLRDSGGAIRHQHVTAVFPASEEIVLGWARQWAIESGDALEISASSYHKVEWAL